jgi:putative FmdB family regulatory protein
MPLYEYECKACHQRTEKIQSFNAPPETVCPKCGGALQRVISAPALQFKGAGWYVNDYAKSGGSPAGASSAAKEKPGSAPAASGDSASPGTAAASDKSAATSSAPASTPSSGS